MRNKNNHLSFYYPKQVGNWSWDWWFNYEGGIKNWFYRKWEYINENKTSKFSGKIILGFTRIDKEWLISPEMAVFEYRKNGKRLVDFLFDLVKNPTKYDLEEDKDIDTQTIKHSNCICGCEIEDTRLFK